MDKTRIDITMQLQKTPVKLICHGLIVLSVLVGCSRHEVRKPTTIPDSAESQSSTAGMNGRNKRSSRGSQYDTLWDRLFALYALPPVDHPDIDRELSWFANHPAYLERAQNRAEPFLYSIVKLVEKKNVPGEIALLPIVESAFQPNVVSPAKAAGIWQFIPSTGTNYGLKRSHSYDGRRDVYASTKAAIKYLKKLHGDFGDWLLAIAAYNCGEGAVGRAIRRNQAAGLPTDFWSLNLPTETRAYVPKLLAVSRLFADAEKYGISLKDLPNMAKYKPVKVSNQLDLALAADAAGISLDKLYELNPGFRGQYADVDGSYHLYIPAEKKAADFRQEVERLSSQRRSYNPYQEPMPVEPGAFQSFRREFSQRSSGAGSGGQATGGRYIPMSYSPESQADPEPTATAPRVRKPQTSAVPAKSLRVASRTEPPAMRHLAAVTPAPRPHVATHAGTMAKEASLRGSEMTTKKSGHIAKAEATTPVTHKNVSNNHGGQKQQTVAAAPSPHKSSSGSITSSTRTASSAGAGTTGKTQTKSANIDTRRHSAGGGSSSDIRKVAVVSSR